jgi:hypothetical protein
MLLDQVEHFAAGGSVHHQFVALPARRSRLGRLGGRNFGFVHARMAQGAFEPALGRGFMRDHVGVFVAGRAERLRLRCAACAEDQVIIGHPVLAAERLAASVAMELIAAGAEHRAASCTGVDFKQRVAEAVFVVVYRQAVEAGLAFGAGGGGEVCCHENIISL